MIRQALTAACAAAALAACTTLTEQPPPANPQKVVDERVALMRGFGGALGASINYTQGKATAAEAHKKVKAAAPGVARVANLFPRGTALGDKGVTQSRALSTIFTNRGDFEAKLDALGGAFATLEAALAKNDKAGATAAAATTRNTCAACHNKYRAPED